MKKNALKIGTLAILIMILLPVGLVFAEIEDYTVLAPLPGTTEGVCDPNKTPPDPNCKTTLEKYLPGVFNLAIGLATVAAVLMIVLGGIQYITTDAIQGKSQGKERIKNAILALVFIISAWLILWTINPKLLTLNLDIGKPITVSAPAGGAGSLQPITTAAYNDLTSQCLNCNLTITSTTGGSHSVDSLHYQGLALDIAPDAQLNEYLTGSTDNPLPCRVVSKTLAGTSARFLWEPAGSTCGGTVPSSGDHWHMSVTP